MTFVATLGGSRLWVTVVFHGGRARSPDFQKNCLQLGHRLTSLGIRLCRVDRKLCRVGKMDIVFSGFQS